MECGVVNRICAIGGGLVNCGESNAGGKFGAIKEADVNVVSEAAAAAAVAAVELLMVVTAAAALATPTWPLLLRGMRTGIPAVGITST